MMDAREVFAGDDLGGQLMPYAAHHLAAGAEPYATGYTFVGQALGRVSLTRNPPVSLQAILSPRIEATIERV